MKTFQYKPKLPNQKYGFTLIELLVVLAVTSLLLTLVFKPLIDGFNLTSRSGTYIESQTTSRELINTINRDLSNAVYVFDNASTDINFWVKNASGDAAAIRLQNCTIDFVAPARQLDQRPGGAATDPTTGQPVYTGAYVQQGGYAFPLAPGQALGRYFIALRDNRTDADPRALADRPNQAPGKPVTLYGNRYSDPRTVSPNEDNRTTLMKAVVQTSIADPDNPNGAYIPNLRLFHTVDASGNITNRRTDSIRIFDPNFFYDNTLAGDDATAGNARWAVPGAVATGPGGAFTIADNWRAVATSVLPTTKADAIEIKRKDDGTTDYVNNLPVVRPLITFNPGFMENDPAVPASIENSGNEAPNPAPSLYTSQFSNWAIPYRVSVYRGKTDTDDPYGGDKFQPVSYYLVAENSQIDFYGNVLKGAVNPTPTTANVGPNADPVTGLWLNADGTFRNPNMQFAFQAEARRGLINFAYPSTVLSYLDNQNRPVPFYYDPAAINSTINADNSIPRYLDLRNNPTTGVGRNTVQMHSPLDVNAPWVTFGTTVRIVPGSERIYGPDQRPGPNYGYRVLYTRVSANAGTVGKNEYKINYEDVSNASAADVNDPRVRGGFVAFNGTVETNSAANSVDENPAAGKYREYGLPQLKFDATAGQNVAADPIEVTYDFQMNRPNDIVKVDYLTREMLSVKMEVRLYDQATGAPQSFATPDMKIRVRNLQR